MKISGAIFDLDGTLLDTMSVWETAGEDYIKSKNLIPQKNFHDHLKDLSLNQAARYIKDNYPISDSDDKIIADISKITESFYINKAAPKKGVIEFLNLLKHNGVKMCIATATERYIAEASLQANNMFEFFGKILTCGEIGQGKDTPLIFKQAFEFLSGDKSSVWVFEDAYFAAATAKKEGFKVCGVYDKWEKRTEDLKRVSDIYIHSFKEAVLFFNE